MLKLVKTTGAGLPSKRIALITALALGTSLTAFGAASANPGMPGGQPPAPGQMQQPGQPGQDQGQNDVQEVLARYGQFMKHDKYGDVWKPMQVAQGWRPYEPCHWVYNQEMQSWFYDDKTEWGAIVHHYGRWTLDQQHGWLWVPGSDFGPGWVAWEMRGNEVGWAPLPPEQDGAIVETAAFKGDPNLWTFVAFASLGKACGGSAPPPPQPRAMMPAMPAPMPAVGGGGYVTGGYTGGYVGGGYVGGYVPGKIIIVNGCWSHPKWCSFWPGKHLHWPKPHHPQFPGGHHPGGHKPGDQAGCKAAWCMPGGKHPGGQGGHPGGHPGGQGGKPPGPDQKCGIAGQFCNGGLNPGKKTYQLIGQNHIKPNWNKPFPTPNKIGQRPHFPNRFVNNGPRFNNRFVMNQPRINHRPMHFQQRSIAPRMNMAPRQSFTPRMSGGGGMRFAGGGGRRR